jgi:TrpR-related protein YerC/YecD
MQDPRLNDAIVKSMTSLNETELFEFLHDLLCESEIENLNRRFEIAQRLNDGQTQRHIADTMKISVTTVSRVSKVLKYGMYGYQRIFISSINKNLKSYAN